MGDVSLSQDEVNELVREQVRVLMMNEAFIRPSRETLATIDYDPDNSKSNRDITKVVIVSLAFALVATVLGTLVLLVIGRDTTPESGVNVFPELPNAIVALSSGLLGALTGFLAPSPIHRR